MENKQNKNTYANFQILKESKTITINKKPKSLLLYSSISNSNINNYQNKKSIPVSRILKYKLNSINQHNNFKDNKFKSIGKNSSYKSKKNYYINSQIRFNTISNNKISLLKLPKIKNNNKESNELKDSLIFSLLRKFDEYDNKFREQEKISEFMIKRGDKYLKLKKDYINDKDEKYKYYGYNHNYKKTYSKLFKRIRNMHLI